MKTTILVWTALLAATKLVYGMELPGWERPLFHADAMKVVAATGEFTSAKKVEMTLTRKDGAQRPTGVNITVDGKDYALEVKEVKIDDCGSTQYVAGTPKPLSLVTHDKTRVVLTDHAMRICDDRKGARWEAKMQHYSENVSDLVSVTLRGALELTGNPNRVVTIMEEVND
jgi:hypothetical protein